MWRCQGTLERRREEEEEERREEVIPSLSLGLAFCGRIPVVSVTLAPELWCPCPCPYPCCTALCTAVSCTHTAAPPSGSHNVERAWSKRGGTWKTWRRRVNPRRCHANAPRCLPLAAAAMPIGLTPSPSSLSFPNSGVGSRMACYTARRNHSRHGSPDPGVWLRSPRERLGSVTLASDGSGAAQRDGLRAARWPDYESSLLLVSSCRTH